MKRPLGVTIFGIANVIIGLFFLIIYSLNFIYPVLIGLVTDSGFLGPYDWFCSVIIYRLSFATFYIFSFILLESGIFLLRMKPASRKLTITASTVMTIAQFFSLLSEALGTLRYHQIIKLEDFFSIWNLIPIIFLFYTILLHIYFNDPDIKREFNDSDVKLSFKKPILIILIAFIFPLIFRGLMYLLLQLYLKNRK